jgi:hypothetical protein
VILAALAVTAVTVMIVYNLQQQLKPEQLAQAKALWEKKRPADYDLEYTQSGSAPGKFQVQVRGGKVVSVRRDDVPLEPRQFRFYSMDGIFDSIEGFLDFDSQPGRPRTFTKAIFHGEDGRVVRYIRRVMGGNERVEIVTKLVVAS